jgi:hypothetical protein
MRTTQRWLTQRTTGKASRVDRATYAANTPTWEFSIRPRGARVLASHTRRLRPLLDKPSLIDNQHTLLGVTNASATTARTSSRTPSASQA